MPWNSGTWRYQLGLRSFSALVTTPGFFAPTPDTIPSFIPVAESDVNIALLPATLIVTLRIPLITLVTALNYTD